MTSDQNYQIQNTKGEWSDLRPEEVELYLNSNATTRIKPSEQNLTAEEHISVAMSEMNETDNYSDVYLEAMKAYALQVAEQVRRECAEKFPDVPEEYNGLNRSIRKVILNVEIKLP